MLVMHIEWITYILSQLVALSACYRLDLLVKRRVIRIEMVCGPICDQTSLGYEPSLDVTGDGRCHTEPSLTGSQCSMVAQIHPC